MIKLKPSFLRDILGMIGFGIILGTVTTWIMTCHLEAQSVGGTSLLFCLAGVTLYVLWRWSGGEPWLGGVMLTAFLLRLILGIGLTLALPHWGYDTPQQNLGYLYYDAFRRDQEAWTLAISPAPVLSALGGRYVSDQYGGMLALSALIYRYLSPDQHRPWLILIMTAWAGALGLPFLARSLQREPFQKCDRLAVALLAFYPEAIFLAASQMRDPFLISLGAVIWWALWDQETKAGKRIGFSLLALGLMALFSWLAAGVWLLVVLSGGGLLYLAHLKVKPGWQWLGMGLGILIVLGMVAFGGWLERVALWDAYLTQRGSGWVQKLLGELPASLELPFIVVYGLFQPVLPGAVFDPSLPIWNAISTLRALGWYAVLPFLFYAPWALRHVSVRSWRFILLWLIGLAWGWTIIASVRAGGDLWDNPRYRAMLLPIFALAVSWVYSLARQSRDPWLWRWIGVEGVGLVFFTEWYVSRTYRVLPRLPFWVMVGAIVSLAGLILVGGWGWDLYQARRASSRDEV